MENTLGTELSPEPGLGKETSPLRHHIQLGLQPIIIHIYYSEYFTRLTILHSERNYFFETLIELMKNLFIISLGTNTTI